MVFAHEYFAEVLESFKNEAERRGYDITFVSNHSKKMTFYEHCLYRNFDGVLVACEISAILKSMKWLMGDYQL